MKLVIRHDARKGRGVFTEKLIKKNEIIETCELLLFKEKELPSDLEGYVYFFDKTRVALALGNGSLYNHSEVSNAEFSLDTETRMLTIRALTTIPKGSEITINYGYTKSQKKKFRINEN